MDFWKRVFREIIFVLPKAFWAQKEFVNGQHMLCKKKC